MFPAPFKYSLWLSVDSVLNKQFAINLDYTVPGGKPFSGTLAASDANMHLSGSTAGGTGLTVPADLDQAVCGKAYLLAELDSNQEVEEVDEKNNVIAFPVIVQCPNGTQTISWVACLIYKLVSD